MLLVTYNYVINFIKYVINHRIIYISRVFYNFMTTLEEHKKIVKELLDDINEKIRADLLVERQKIIGFTTSEASTNIFAIFLHKNNLISPGFNVNHRFFMSNRKAEEIFNFDFQKKKKILDLLIKQEDLRNKLCYGREKEKIVAESAIKNLFMLKGIIENLLGEKI